MEPASTFFLEKLVMKPTKIFRFTIPLLVVVFTIGASLGYRLLTRPSAAPFAAPKVVRIESLLPTTRQPLLIPVFNPERFDARLVRFRTTCGCSTPDFEQVIVASNAAIDVPATLNTHAMLASLGHRGAASITPIFSSQSSSHLQEFEGAPISLQLDLIPSVVQSPQSISVDCEGKIIPAVIRLASQQTKINVADKRLSIVRDDSDANLYRLEGGFAVSSELPKFVRLSIRAEDRGRSTTLDIPCQTLQPSIRLTPDVFRIMPASKAIEAQVSLLAGDQLIGITARCGVDELKVISTSSNVIVFDISRVVDKVSSSPMCVEVEATLASIEGTQRKVTSSGFLISQSTK
jgi:hypothetical protein